MAKAGNNRLASFGWQANFFVLFFAAFFFPVKILHAQVTTDEFQPFHQGQAIEVPGTTEYLGDLPQDIQWSSDPAPFHTFDGLLAQQAGWVGPGTPAALGVNNGSPGLFFEGIAYPLESAAILNWLPVARNLELLNFPAAAWWGPAAASGGLQIRLPDSPEAPMGNLALWGGSGGSGGGEGFYRDPSFSLDGNIQHGFLNGPTSDTFQLLSGTQWLAGGPFTVQSGFLGSQWFGAEDWYALYGSLRWESPNFQSLELKPFVQTAKSDGLDVLEYGSQLNYHFNMAGVAESQVGLGFSHEDFLASGASSGPNRGYLQNTENLDALGDLSLNLAFRWDFSSAAKTLFSTLLGAQYRMGDFRLIGNFEKDVDPLSGSDVVQGEFGFANRPDEEWALDCKYVYEQLGNSAWNGARTTLQWAPGATVLLLFQQVHLDAEEQALQGSTGGPVLFDTGAKLSWSFFQPLSFWVSGRSISGQVFYGAAGADCLLKDQARIYTAAENITNPPVSWPDPTAPTGRVFWLGAETGF